MFRDLSSTRLSQFNSNTETFVPDGLQECSQMNTNSYRLVNGLVADFYDEGIVKLVQILDKCLNHNGDYREK
jgi:hypothetical protein